MCNERWEMSPGGGKNHLVVWPGEGWSQACRLVRARLVLEGGKSPAAVASVSREVILPM